MSEYKKPRIAIRKTPTEWRLIDDKISELKRANLSSFMRCKISALAKEYAKSRREICQALEGKEKTERRYWQINPEDLKILEVISLKTGLSVSHIVNEIILNPLLKQKD